MTVCEEKKYTAGLKRRVKARPFIRPLVPFIGQNKPGVIPFICHKLPSVHNTRYLGVTLVELMVALVVLSVLAGIAAPSFRNFLQRNRITAHINNIVTDITYARTEAIKRGGVNAEICNSNDQTSCTATSWGDGWIVWVDLDGDAVTDSDEILRTGPATPADRGTWTSAQDSITFTASGAVVSTANIQFCAPTGISYGRTINVALTGQSSVTSAACP